MGVLTFHLHVFFFYCFSDEITHQGMINRITDVVNDDMPQPHTLLNSYRFTAGGNHRCALLYVSRH